MEVQIDNGTVGNSDGSVEIWHSCNKVVDIINTIIYKYAACKFEEIRFASFIGACGVEATEHFDDVYIDNTWVRVVIGNNAVFADCTHREMQLPTAWAGVGNSITFTFNQGSFASSNTVYIFVVDVNGNKSSGYAVTIA